MSIISNLNLQQTTTWKINSKLDINSKATGGGKYNFEIKTISDFEHRHTFIHHCKRSYWFSHTCRWPPLETVGNHWISNITETLEINLLENCYHTLSSLRPLAYPHAHTNTSPPLQHHKNFELDRKRFMNQKVNTFSSSSSSSSSPASHSLPFEKKNVRTHCANSFWNRPIFHKPKKSFDFFGFFFLSNEKEKMEIRSCWNQKVKKKAERNKKSGHASLRPFFF